jgi:UDP:flavonoid glycosyltransferase YjiC (YdhE family)
MLGHVSPCVAVTKELVSRGHRVRFLTGRNHQERVEAAGATFLPLPAEADFDDTDMAAAFPQLQGMTGIRGLSAIVLEVFSKPIDAQFAAVTEALRTELTDVILSEMLFAGVYPIALQPRAVRPAVGILGISPMTLKGPGLPPYGMGLLPARTPLERVRNRILHLLANGFVLRPAQRYLAQSTQRLVGRRLGVPFFEMPGLGDALLHLGIQGFEYPRPSARTKLIFTGPLISTATGSPLPPWHADLEGRRVVHVTQGTVANTDFSTLVAPTVRALADQDCIVVVTGGGRPESEVEASLTAELGSVPDNVRIGAYLDYSWLFPRLDVLITNGGYGGVNLALQHGVPLVVAGNTEEKPEVGARVAWTGAGVRLLVRTPTPEQIVEAVREVGADPRYRENAARLGAEIDRAPGVDAVEDFILTQTEPQRRAVSRG